MPELGQTNQQVITLKVDDEIVEKENNFSTVDSVYKEPPKFSEIHISFLIAFVECDYQKVNSILSKDPLLVNMKNPFDGNTPLHFACKFGDIALIRSLIGNYKADINIINNSGKTPLHYAAEFSQEETANILVSIYNARKNIRDYSGKLPIDWVKPDKLEVFDKILGDPSLQETVKEEKGFSTKLKQFGSFLLHDNSSKHLKLAQGSIGDQRGTSNSMSVDVFSKRNHLSLSNAELDKATRKTKFDKSNNKNSSPSFRGSFSGKIS